MSKYIVRSIGYTTPEEIVSSSGIVALVSVANIANPSAELASQVGLETGNLLLAYQKNDGAEDCFTLYAWDVTVLSPDVPYIVSGAGGSWRAIAGNYAIRSTVKGFSAIISDLVGTDLTAEGMICTHVVGESVDFGDICYFKSDSKAWKASASGVGTYPAMVMALESIGAGSSCRFLSSGFARNDAWSWTVGGLLYLNTSAGGMTHTPPSNPDNVIQVVGIAFPNGDTVNFNPQMTYITHT